MPLRAVQVAPEAIKVTEKQLLAQIHETQLADDPFLDFEDVRAFFESTTTCSAFDILQVHRPFKNERLKKVELFCILADLNKLGYLKKSTSMSAWISLSNDNGK